jgi:DNA-3-methyladenine glycosylase II
MHARIIASAADIEAGLEALCLLDARLAAVRERAGPVPLRRREPGYDGLAEVIVGQMVSKASAAALWQRLIVDTDGARPDRVAALSDGQCRLIGLSRAKERTLKCAAAAVIDGVLDPVRLCGMPSEDAISEMTRIPGIGPWTAEVYLLFCAGHADVFPAGDVALQSAVAHALELGERPAMRDLRRYAERWKPWRGVAARLFWAYYSTEMGRGDVIATG